MLRFSSCLLSSLFFILSSCADPNNQLKNTATQTDTVIIPKKNHDTIVAVKPVIIDTPHHVIDSLKKYIYLTFDDGPQNGTQSCFEIFKKHGVKATFFMVGINEQRKPDGRAIVQSIQQAAPQYLVANHSFSHAYEKYRKFYHDPNGAFEDFLHGQKELQINNNIIRLPGNSAWVTKERVKATHLVKPVCLMLDSAGFNVIGWDLEWGFNHKTAYPLESATQMAEYVDEVFSKQKTNTPNHLVILAHDRMFRKQNFSDSLSRFLTLVQRNKDYVFETLDNYPGLK